MRITGVNPPGRTFCRPDESPMNDFLYLTWGNVGPDGAFEMFRRAKLMLDRVDPQLIESAIMAGRLEAAVDLTGPDGGPRCARVDPPAVSWSVPTTT